MNNKQNLVRKQFDNLAKDYKKIKQRNQTYINELKNIFCSIVKPDSRVLEIGCGTADILACTHPKNGVGIDISPSMISIAKSGYPEYDFYCGSIENFDSEKIKLKFDYILIPDVIEYFSDFDQAFLKIKNFCRPSTKIIITSANALWVPALVIAEKLNLKMQDSYRKWPSNKKIMNILERNGFVIEKCSTRLLIPKNNLLFKSVNKNFHKIPLLRKCGLIMVFVAGIRNKHKLYK